MSPNDFTDSVSPLPDGLVQDGCQAPPDPQPGGPAEPEENAEQLPLDEHGLHGLGRAGLPLRRPRTRGKRLVLPAEKPEPVSPQQRLLLLDTWQRSGLPAGDFAALVGISKHTLYAWKKKFDTQGPAGLMDQPRGGPSGSRLPELTKRTILMLKQANPDWGCQRISDMLLRGPALPASASAVARVLHEAGYELEEVPTRPHPDKVRHFERAKPNQLWQTDLFTFVLKRQNRRVYLVAFMDDHSRFIVGYGLHASQSSALVLEVLRAAMTSLRHARGDPDRQRQPVRDLARQERLQQGAGEARHPAGRGPARGGRRRWARSNASGARCGGSASRRAVFLDLGDAQRRIGLFIDHYNFQRPHQGIDGLVPADRFFGAAPEVLRTLQARVAANALELARHGVPKAPFYLTGQVGGQPFSVHAEGERVILTGAAGQRQEIDLVPPPAAAGTPACPSRSVRRAWCSRSWAGRKRGTGAGNVAAGRRPGSRPTAPPHGRATGGDA